MKAIARTMPRLSAISLLAGAASLLAVGAAQADDGQPVKGGTVIAALNSEGMVNLNTLLTTWYPSLLVADVWADGLMTYDKNGNRLPRMATSWTISDDGKVYTFKIREGVKWSDGKPFSAADVAYTVEAFAKYSAYFAKLLPLLDSASAPDDKTFVLKLKQPLTATLDLFDKEVFPLMPKHIYEGKEIATNPANVAPVGLGPFKFEKWVSGQSISFVRNPYYWDAPKPYLDSVIFALIPNIQQRYNAMVNGEVNWFKPEAVQVPATQQAAKKGTFRIIPIVNNAPETSVIDFNLRRAPMNNVKVRQALFLAIDRQRIVQDVYQGLAETAKNAIPTQFKALHDDSVNYDTLYPFDLKKAGQVLDEAGYPLKDGKRFSVELTAPSMAPYDAVAQVVQAQWTALGIDVKLSVLDQQIWINKVDTKHDFDASIISLTGRSNPVLGVDRSFICNETSVPYANPTGYCNPEFDKVAAQAAAAPLGQQKPFYKTYAEIVARDLNQAALTNAKAFEAVTTNFKNIDAQFNFSFNTHPNWAEAWLPKDKQ